ncbi:MAG: hypothetical protein HYV75_06890 [Opitutae bacterium]|nr:hypothetical protein [Opitutae bacterium]
MSPPKTNPDSPALPADDLRRELEAKVLLIQQIRQDLIQAQITVLELNDTIMLKETEKADAISILAELELALEAKITHIVALDQELNRQITVLKGQLAGETAEKHARDKVIEDLVQKLDAANREIGSVHKLAGDYARDLAQAREQVQHLNGELTATQATLAGTQSMLTETRQQLAETAAARAALEHRVSGMEATLSWRLTKPFRALRRMLS